MTAPVRYIVMSALAFLILVTLVISLGAVIYVVDTSQKIRATQLEGTPLGKKIEKSTDDTAETLALLQSCIDPKGECGKRSAANLERLLAEGHEDRLTVAACADKRGVQTRKEIAECVERFKTQESPGP